VAREGRAREERSEGRCGVRDIGRGTGRGAGLGLRTPGGTRPPRHVTTAAAAVFVPAARAEMAVQLGSSVVAFGSRAVVTCWLCC